MPYCPNCRYEFRDTVKVCPECKKELVDQPPQQALAQEEFVEIYTVSNRMEAEIIKGLFEENGLPMLVRDMRVFPVLPDFGRRADLRIAVSPKHLQQARRLLEEARQDGALTEQGSFL